MICHTQCRCQCPKLLFHSRKTGNQIVNIWHFAKDIRQGTNYNMLSFALGHVAYSEHKRFSIKPKSSAIRPNYFVV